MIRDRWPELSAGTRIAVSWLVSINASDERVESVLAKLVAGLSNDQTVESAGELSRSLLNGLR